MEFFVNFQIKDLMHEVQTQIEEMTTSKQEELMGGR